MGSRNLFTFIMEADDDIEDFDATAATGDDAGTTEPDATSAPNDAGSGSSNDALPPEMNDTGTNDSFDFNPEGDDADSTGDEDLGSGDDGGNDADEDNKEGDKLGAKTNDILNERLYRRLTERNAEIEADIKQIQQILSVLPYETAEALEKPITQLKTALSKGQSYAIDNFVRSEYGVNLTYFEKLNALYTLIEDNIDKEIRKVNKD